MPGILPIGEDEVLQRTRTAVLQKSGAPVVCARPDGAVAAQAKDECSLAIFCHSVQPSARPRLTRTMRERWPATKLLLVVWDEDTAGVAVPAGLGAVVSREPETLVRTVRALLAAL